MLKSFFKIFNSVSLQKNSYHVVTPEEKFNLSMKSFGKKAKNLNVKLYHEEETSSLISGNQKNILRIRA